MTVQTNDEQPNPDEAGTEQPNPAEQPKDADLGEGGKKAIAAEREARERAEARVRELEAEQEEARKAALSDQERAIEEAREQARAEEREKAAADIAKAKAIGKAEGRFHDPEDAIEKAGITADMTDDQIKAALDKVATDKPWLAKTGSGGGGVSQGPRGGVDAGGGKTPDEMLREAFASR